MRHGISIPTPEKEEMLNFLTEGPPEGEAPGWIDWGDNISSSSEDNDDDNTSSESSDNDSDGEDLPFLTLPKNKNGRTCRCGSDTHLTIQSHACRLNPRNRRAVCVRSSSHTDTHTHTLTLTITLTL